MQRRCLVKLPERIADQSLTQAETEVKDAKDDDGSAEPKASAREFIDCLPERDAPAVLFGAHDHEQDDGRGQCAPELAEAGALVERHAVEPRQQMGSEA